MSPLGRMQSSSGRDLGGFGGSISQPGRPGTASGSAWAGSSSGLEGEGSSKADGNGGQPGRPEVLLLPPDATGIDTESDTVSPPLAETLGSSRPPSARLRRLHSGKLVRALSGGERQPSPLRRSFQAARGSESPPLEAEDQEATPMPGAQEGGGRKGGAGAEWAENSLGASLSPLRG